jgi:YbbR domain-containing protein
MFRWLTANIRSLALAFVLALAVWVSSVTAADPDEVSAYPHPIKLEFVGQDPSLINVSSSATQVTVTLRAPRSVWELIKTDSNAVRAIVDLSGLSAGSHTLNVQIQIAERPARMTSVTPEKVEVVLEPLVTRTMPVEFNVLGDPATGYQADAVQTEIREVIVSGPESMMNSAAKVEASLTINEAREDINATLIPQVVDKNGEPIIDLSITPNKIPVTVPIKQEGGYRDIAVKVVVEGQVASGYHLTNISVYPPVITVYSTDPNLIKTLQGYVETLPFDLTNADQDIETRLHLILPEGVTVVGEQTVLVQAGISAIESSITISNKQVEIVGLGKGLAAQISPKTVDIILSGPVPVLDKLSTDDIQVVVDLTGLTTGTHQIAPRVNILVNGVRVETLNPATVGVVIGLATPTPRP